MRAPFLLAALLAGAAVSGGPAAAQQSLYGVQADAAAAYIRVVNALDGEVEIRSDFLPAQKLGTEAGQRVGAYTVVNRVAGRPLRLDVRRGAATIQATLRAEPGSFTSLVLRRGPDGKPGVAAVTRQGEFNQARALLSFYNAASGCAAAALTLSPGGQAVFQDVAPGTVKSRSINPVTAQVQAACDGRPSPSVALDGLEAGGTYSLWLIDPGERPVAFLVPDKASAWRP